jgi:ATP-binding cassette subfamily B protein
MRLRQQRPIGSKRRILTRTLWLFRPYAPQITLLIALIAATSVLELLPALILKEIVDAAVPRSGDLGAIDRLFALLVAAVASSALLGVGMGYVNQSVGQSVMYRLRQDLHGHLQRLSMRFFTQTRTGEILSRISTDVNGVQQAVTGTFTELLQNTITLAAALGIMFWLEWRLALVALVVLPLWVFPTMKVGLVQRRLMREWHEESARMSAHVEETLSISGSMLVKTFGRQEHEAARFDDSNRTLRSLSIRRMMAGRWFNMATGLFGALAPGAVYWFGGRAIVGEDLTLGVVVAFAVLTQRVFQPFASIARINTTALSSLAVFERIFEYLDSPVEVDERPDATTLPQPRGAIRFDDVTFAYGPTGSSALHDVSFEVEPGQMVALVGPSGAGKTTITYLLQRFYDPQGGRVLLDGHDVRDLTLDSVAGAVGAVMQETYLFHASLLENIRYGRLVADNDEVHAAATAAGLDGLIDSLPEGFGTIVGERGYRLSGGEKQRVAIARAILKEPPVMILDEATASLDSRLEREIREATARLARGRTTVVIAHRLSTVIAADVILVLDHGHIVERGQHGELLRRGGLYAALYREQFEDPSAESTALATAP